MLRSTWIAAAAGLVVGAATIAVVPSQRLFVEHRPAEAHGEVGVRYACPMMDFIGSRPGSCPVCGMQMQPMRVGDYLREQQERMGLKTTTVAAGEAKVLVRAYGAARYDMRRMQVVIPRVAGRIVKRHAAALHEGDLIKVGDPIIDLYSPNLYRDQVELATAVRLGDRNALDAFRDRFARLNLSALADAIIGGAKPVDTVTIYSPFAGRIVLPEASGMGGGEREELPEVGSTVAEDHPLLTVVDPTSYMIVVHVPEAQARFLRVGQRARVATDDAGELAGLDARIDWLASELNPEIRARETHIHVRDAQGSLFAGSLVSARFESILGPDLSPADPANPATWGKHLLVPKSAVLSTGVRSVAWRVAERKPNGTLRFELAPLALGPRLERESGEDVYLVRGGLKPGDEVATQGAFLVDSQAQLAGAPSLLFPDGASAPAPAHQH